MKFFISALLFIAVSIANAALVGDAELTPVIEQNELLWTQYNITITSSTGKKNRITVVDCIDKTAEATGFQFVKQIIDALKQIQSTGIGNLLLEDIALNDRNDLVVFNTNLYDTILKRQEEIIGQFELGNQDAHRQIIATSIPQNVKDWFSGSQVMSIDDFLYNSRNYQCFSNLIATKFRKNIIFVGMYPFGIIQYNLFELEKPIVALNKYADPLPLHMHLFHELNHYRHFSKNIGTYEEDGSTLMTKNGEEISLDDIKIDKLSQRGVVKFRPKMTSSEEELQQIGYTITISGKEIFDPVNETYYRIQRKMDVRFPYNGKDGFETTDPKTVYTISSQGLTNILTLSTIDKKPIAAAIIDTILRMR
jgi:hypothetical protein